MSLQHYTTEFANGVAVTSPAAATLNNGFACGPASAGDFNWLFNVIYLELERLDAESTVNSAAPTTGFTRGTIA